MTDTVDASTCAALYIHWPFCKKKCPYCDFNSHVRESIDQRAWQNALLAQMREWRARTQVTQITSVFFGGGTPSLMPVDTVAALIAEIRKLWHCADDMEITLEANPTSVEAEKFAALAEAGVNRVSLGVQSLRPEALKFLGREHSVAEARQAIALAAKYFPRYTFDLIYALPEQTLHTWETELREALTLAQGHLSLYQLTIEANTAFHHAYYVGKQFDLPDDIRAVSLYERTREVMMAAGLPPYEISNYAASGQESRHNLSYWQGDYYFGIGPGAHGRVPQADGCYATKYLASPERWLESGNGGLEEYTRLSDAERMEEKILMGLRLVREGFALHRLTQGERAAWEARTADGRLTMLQDAGLLTLDRHTLRATDAGVLVLNQLIAELLDER